MFNKTQLIKSRAKTPTQVPLSPSPGHSFPYMSAALPSGHQEVGALDTVLLAVIKQEDHRMAESSGLTRTNH